MSTGRIMIVEDEGIIAEDIAMSLRGFGYEVCAIATTAQDAIELACAKTPDLVVMDVVLQGEMDGITAAERIKENLRVPVVYLTAYADEEILDRASLTEPFGYLIKPFREQELHSTIRMALVKHELERQLRESREWLIVTLRSIGDAVIAAGPQSRVKFINQAAEALTGWSQAEAQGKKLTDVFRTVSDGAEASSGGFAAKLTAVTGEATLSDREHRLIARNGAEIAIDACGAAIRSLQGEVIGWVVIFRDITEIKRAQETLEANHEALATYSSTLEAKVRERTRDLEESQRELERYSRSLEKSNEALKIIIGGIEEQKKEVEEKIKQNLNLTVRPILEQLECQEVSDTVRFLLQSLGFNLTNMFSSFGFSLTKANHKLTPREIRICEMIRSGLSSKQIAQVMSISPQTVLVHRKNIRKKLGMDRSRRNLATFLKTKL